MLKSNFGLFPILLTLALCALSGCSSEDQIVQYNVRSSGSSERGVGQFEYLDESGKLVTKHQLLPFAVEIKAKKGQKLLVLVEGMFPQNKYEVEIAAGKDVDSLESVCRARATGNREIAVCKGELGEVEGSIKKD